MKKQLLTNKLWTISDVFKMFKMSSAFVTSENDIIGVWIFCFYKFRMIV